MVKFDFQVCFLLLLLIILRVYVYKFITALKVFCFCLSNNKFRRDLRLSSSQLDYRGFGSTVIQKHYLDLRFGIVLKTLLQFWIVVLKFCFDVS